MDPGIQLKQNLQQIEILSAMGINVFKQLVVETKLNVMTDLIDQLCRVLLKSVLFKRSISGTKTWYLDYEMVRNICKCFLRNKSRTVVEHSDNLIFLVGTSCFITIFSKIKYKIDFNRNQTMLCNCFFNNVFYKQMCYEKSSKKSHC